MHTRMFRVGEVARCLTCDAHCPETKEDYIVDHVCVSREVTEVGHGGTSEEDDKAKDRDGEVRGVQSTHSTVSIDPINIPCDNKSWN